MPAQDSISVFRHHNAYRAAFSGWSLGNGGLDETLPTAFTAQADPLDVLDCVTRHNPTERVILVPASAGTRWAQSNDAHLRHDPSWN